MTDKELESTIAENGTVWHPGDYFYLKWEYGSGHTHVGTYNNQYYIYRDDNFNVVYLSKIDEIKMYDIDNNGKPRPWIWCNGSGFDPNWINMIKATEKDIERNNKVQRMAEDWKHIDYVRNLVGEKEFRRYDSYGREHLLMEHAAKLLQIQEREDKINLVLDV